MAYTPINWQTGDTITAAKLNRCDNGWGYESTQLFSETVTTTDTGDGYAAGQFDYWFENLPPEVVVTFDGTDYTCERNEQNGYGDIGPAFTRYPFYLYSDRNGTHLLTDTAGTHTVAVSVSSVECSDNFANAVSTVLGQLQIGQLWLEQGVTTQDEFYDALNNYKIVCFYAGTGIRYVSGLSNSDVVYVPEDANIRAYFDPLNNDTFAIEWL